MKGPEARPAPQTRALRPGPQESGCWVFERQEPGRRPRRPPSRSEPWLGGGKGTAYRGLGGAGRWRSRVSCSAQPGL